MRPYALKWVLSPKTHCLARYRVCIRSCFQPGSSLGSKQSDAPAHIAMNQTFRRKLLFRIRRHTWPRFASRLRAAYWRLLGMEIGTAVRLYGLRVTWPHRVRLGDGCSLEHSIYFNIAGGYRDGGGVTIGKGTFVGSGCEFNITSAISIGEQCLIASGCRFIDHNHGTGTNASMKSQVEDEQPIRIGSDVWIGVNCVVLKGVSIGDGAIVAAGSVVTRSLESMGVYAGVPARLLRLRSRDEMAESTQMSDVTVTVL